MSVHSDSISVRKIPPTCPKYRELLLEAFNYKGKAKSKWDETRPSHLYLKSTNEEFSVGF